MTRVKIRNLALLICGIAVLGCTTAVPTETPGVDRLGEYILRQEGPEVDAILAYRFAALNPGEEWLMLEVAFSSPNRAEGTIDREGIFVQTPSGVKIPLATQAEFAEDFTAIQAKVRKADIARDPMDYFPPNRRPCELRFFTEPGRTVVYDEVSVNDRRACTGRLYFKIPGGTQVGRWIFGVDLEESRVRIPFTL